MSNYRISYVSSACGTGKTYSTAKYISRNRDIGNYMIVCPTRVLLEQTRDTLVEFGVIPKVIHSETQDETATGAIVEYLKSAHSVGEVLLITWQAFLKMPYFHHRERWQVIIDEVPQIDTFYALEPPHDLDMLRELFQVLRPINEFILQLVPPSRSAVRRFLKRTDISGDLRRLLQECLSGAKDIFVRTDSWTAVMEKGKASEKPGDGCLYIITMLRPKNLENAILLGANVQDSLLFSWFQRFHGVQWEEHAEIKKGLRTLPSCAHRLSIYYFFEQRYSKRLAQSVTDNGQIAIDVMEEKVVEFMEGKPCLYVINKDRIPDTLSGDPNMKQIPVLSNGLNDYQDYHNIYISAALNRTPIHFKTLEWLGFTSQQVHRACNHEIYYQNAFRTSLRNPKSNEKVIAIVPDKASAHRIASLSGSTEIHQLCSIIDPKITFTSEQKRKRRVMKNVLELLRNPTSLPFPYSSKGFGSEIGSDTRSNQKFERFLRISGSNPQTIIVTLHDDPKLYRPDQCHVLELDVQQFIQLLREHAGTVVKTKEEGMLFNPCYFDPPDDPEGYRRPEYFSQSSFLVLDFDGGTMSHDEFIRIFWDEAGEHEKRSFIICNSFSRCKENPNKFRVIMFYKRPALSLAEHEAVLHNIISRLEINRYPLEDIKLDSACQSGIQSFWLPCTNKKHQEWAFFIQKGTKTADIRKYGIDPELYSRTVAVPDQQEHSSSTRKRLPPTREEIDKITETVRNLREDRHTPFFLAGLRLYDKGLPIVDVERELQAILPSDPKKKRWVKDAIRSIKGYRRLK